LRAQPTAKKRRSPCHEGLRQQGRRRSRSEQRQREGDHQRNDAGGDGHRADGTVDRGGSGTDHGAQTVTAKLRGHPLYIDRAAAKLNENGVKVKSLCLSQRRIWGLICCEPVISGAVDNLRSGGLEPGTGVIHRREGAGDGPREHPSVGMMEPQGRFFFGGGRMKPARGEKSFAANLDGVARDCFI
jgi:hypothetical protein